MARTDTANEYEWQAEGLAFKRLYESKDLKQNVIAEALGVSPDAVSRYSTGRTRIPAEHHAGIARLFEMTPEELRKRIVLKQPSLLVMVDDMDLSDKKGAKPLAYERPNVRPANVETVDYVDVPIYGAISAHRSEYNLSDVVETIKLPKAQGGREQWGRVVSGTCMEIPEEPGEGFEDGDIAIFEDAPYEDGMGVHAFRRGEETFKVYREIKGRKELWPTNFRDGSEVIVVEDGDWEIRGVCMGRIRRGKGFEDTRRYPHGYRFRFRQTVALEAA